jgi:DNA invertase Pin-like site-specific DNA recombinase
MDKTRAAIYSRVSTTDKGQSVGMQVAALHEYCARMGLEVAEYSDQMSAARLRPGLNQMLEDARLGKFGTLVVWKLDRLFRSTIHCVETLEKLATSWGVRFVSLQDGLDIDPIHKTPMQEFQLTLFSALAQLERAIIRERVRAGVAHARSKGRKLGRPRVVMDAEKVVRMRGEGRSWAQIASELRQTMTSVRRVYKRYMENKSPEAAQLNFPEQEANS